MKYEDMNNLTKELYTKLDTTIKNFIENDSGKIDCKEGCSLCCKTPSRIEVLPSEAFYIANHLKNTLKKVDLDNLIEKFYENKIKLENKTLIECTKILTPCPLLINESCSIYKVRPFVCRLLLSRDYNICLDYTNFQGHPDNLLNTIFDEEIYIRYIKKIKEEKLFCEPIELNDALYTVLTQNDTLNKYLQKKQFIFNELYNR